MDAKSFYGHTINRVRINDLEGVQHLQEDVALEVIPEDHDSGEESDSLEDEIENFRSNKVCNTLHYYILEYENENIS